MSRSRLALFVRAAAGKEWEDFTHMATVSVASECSRRHEPAGRPWSLGLDAEPKRWFEGELPRMRGCKTGRCASNDSVAIACGTIDIPTRFSPNRSAATCDQCIRILR